MFAIKSIDSQQTKHIFSLFPASHKIAWNVLKHQKGEIAFTASARAHFLKVPHAKGVTVLTSVGSR